MLKKQAQEKQQETSDRFGVNPKCTGEWIQIQELKC